MDNVKLAGYVGLARRAGKCAVGNEAAVRALQMQKAEVVLVESGYSHLLQKLMDLCRGYQVSCYMTQGLGNMIGNQTCKAVAICEKGFGKAISQLFESTENEGYKG